MANPEICVLKTDGINCDVELARAFEVAGANTQTVHVNEIRSGEKKLSDFHGLGLPGGFSYGDDIASGAVIANELTQYLGDELREFVESKKPIVGICNGFQVLTRTGLLPNRKLGQQEATLAHNDIGHFVCKWVELVPEDSICEFAPQEEFDTALLPMQIAHGEGRFVAKPTVLEEMRENRQVVFTYQENPNGSTDGIAGICDPTGLILGMMPHPERSISNYHPDRSKTHAARLAAAVIFDNFVNYARNS